MKPEEIVIDLLYKIFQKQGYVTEEDIYELCEKYDLSFVKTDYVGNQILARGVMISEGAVKKTPEESIEEASVDYAQVNYEEIYADILKECPGLAPVVMFAKLANLINAPKLEAPVKTFEIYQIRRVDETRDVRFEPYERLLKAGIKPDFKTYDKMYEADVSMLSGKSTGEKLESAFYVFNQERPEDFKGHSLSVSDVVVLDDTAYYVDSVGFKPLKDFIPLEIQQSRFLDTLPQTLQGISDNATELEAVSDKALNLNIPSEIIREACDMVKGGESLDNMANAYEEKFTEKNAPAEEAPEIDKPKPQKKPKL